MPNKKEEKQSKIDLSQIINDLRNDPIIDSTKYVLFDQPETITTSNGQSIEGVSRMFVETEPLTYQTAIQQALLFNPERDVDVPPVEKRTALAMKLSIEPEISLTSTEKNHITKCAKSYYSRQGQQSIIYLRILELVDKEEFQRLM